MPGVYSFRTKAFIFGKSCDFPALFRNKLWLNNINNYSILCLNKDMEEEKRVCIRSRTARATTITTTSTTERSTKAATAD